MGKITLMIPKEFFTNDFLEIEVKKQLGVRGDALIQHFRGEMQRIHKHNKGAKIFSHDMMYTCKMANDKVVFTGSKI